MYDELRNCSLANPLQLSETFEDIHNGSKNLGQIPEMFNLDTDPKERYNLFGRSGGVALFEPMMRDVVVPGMISFKKFPNKDYSKMTRNK